MKSEFRSRNSRGIFDHGWLQSAHSFSFGDYRNRDRMHFRSLRVINEDRIAPNDGFDPHPHQNMEIMTFVTQGSLEHKDSMGNGSMILPGEIQYMSAGTGVTHSEWNAEKQKITELFQIWILPNELNAPPRYSQSRLFETNLDRQPRIKLAFASADDPVKPVIEIRQKARLWIAELPKNSVLTSSPYLYENLYLQAFQGQFEVSFSKTSPQKLVQGDAMTFEGSASSPLEPLQFTTTTETGLIGIFELE